MQILKRMTMLAFVFAAFAVTATAQLTGTKNVPGDYATVAAAVTDLNTQGVGAGGVTFIVADGYTETAPAGGFTITNPTGNGAGNPIVFRRATSVGTRPAFTANGTLVAGTLTDAIFKIVGTDNLTIDGFSLLENAANTTTTAASNNMTEFGVALLYATTTNGSQNVTIQNCIIDLNRTYQNTFGIYSNSTHSATAATTSATATTVDGGNSGLKIYSNSVTDVNIGIVVVGPTASADHNDGLDIGGTLVSTGNSITDYGTTGTFSSYANVSGTVNGILVRNTKNFNVSYNSIVSSNGGVTAGTLRGVFVNAFTNAPTGTITNSINNNNISLRSGLATGAMLGIVNEATTVSTTTTLNINNNDFLNTGHTVAGSGAITFISQAATTLNTNINSNTFTNMTVNTTGSVTFITNSVTHPAGAATNVNNNSVVTAFSKTGAGGTVFFYDAFGSTTSGTETNTGNNFSNMTFTGATTISGFRSADGATPFPSKTVTNNTFNNISNGAGTITILTVGFSPATPASNVSGNIISNISGGSSVLGITSSAGTQNFFSNTINTLSSTGASAVTGISITGGVTQSVYKNKIYDLSGNNAATTVNGVLVSTAPTTGNIYNNLIGDLRATAATSATTPVATDAIRGINVTATTATTTLNVSFNTVYLNATSSGANFSSSALFATTSATATTATLNLRNNILVNLSTPAGTGIAAAYRRSSTDLTNYGSASNNNDFYAGTPSATRLIFYDGTNSDQTLAAYKARVASRDSNSVSENPNFLSTTGSNANFLHINTATPTQLESGGIPVSGITDDFDAQTRNVTTPDIGADEFAGVVLDLNPPSITYTAVGNTTLTTNRVITATITDISGVAGGANSPRIYFRKNGGAYSSTQCVLTGGSSYDCTIDYSLVGGVVATDVIDYFIVAQDTNGNVGANPSAGFSATNVNTITTPPTTPNTYTIVAGFPTSVNVGTGETYTGLTTTGGLFAALNSSVLTGNVTINVTSDLTLETGAVALNQLTEEGAGAGTYTVTIKPSGAARVVSGTNGTGAIIRLNGADRVTIDGSTSGGTDRSLTITNNSTATSTAAIHIISLGVNAGATNNTIKNTNLSGGADQSTSVNVTYGISHGGALLGNGGADNDNNSFINNAITKVNIGIYSSGESLANPVQNTVMANNLIGPAAFGADQIGRAGIIFNQSNNASITNNEVRFVGVTDAQTSTGGSYDKFGITHAFNGWSDTLASGDLGVTNTVISRNKVHDIVEENTFSAVGIFMAGGSGTNDTLNTTVNNFIWNVRANGTSGDNSASIGIASGKGDTVAYNSIYMAGDLDPLASAASTTPSIGIQVPNTTVVNLNLKNNVAFVDLTSSSTSSLVNAVIKVPTGFSWGTGGSNYNDFYSPISNTQMIFGRVGATDFPTLAAWQTATSQDANSKSVDPLFVSTTDLHLQSGSTVRASATPIAGITTDIDGDTRNPTTPDMGADEFASFVFPTVQFSAATYSGAEGTSATVTVTRSGDTSVASTINYATSNGTATGGATCGSGVDYENASGTFNYAVGETSKTFNVVLCSDAVSKGNETVNLTLTAPTNATLGTPSAAVLTITNVNAPVPGTLQFSASTYSVAENGGTASLTVSRTGGSDGAVAVNYTLSGGTATGGATCGGSVDYVNTGGTLNFANGETSKTIIVTICNDTVFEGAETFNASLSGATGGATIGSPSTAIVTITDDKGQPTVQFSSATYTTTETLSGLGAPGATITVTLSGASQSAVTVNYATSNGTATGGASCAAGVDYLSASGTLTFNAGETSKTFFVTTCSDTTFEGDETVNLTLSSPVGATLGTPNPAVLTIVENDTPPVGGPVTVTATAGTPTASYNTLTEAVTAINAGTHQGAIVVSVNQNTTEPGTVVLNGSGAGSASYTSIAIRAGADNVTVSGASATGRGLIELNGADNVTIDGDNPTTSGTNRNLTLQNTAANTVAFTSVIRVAVAATGTTSADNNAFRNLNILGSATGRNIAAAISTTGSENTTFGIFAGPGASTTDGTVAPTAVISVATSVAAGATATNLVVSNNDIRTAARAVSMNGAATTVFPGLQINGNSIGNPTAGNADQVYAIGITAQGSADAIIRENTIWVEGYNASSASTHAINVGVNSALVTGATIERNVINRVRNNNPSSWSAFGINLGGGNNHVVQNNFVSGVLNNQTAGTGAFGATFGAYGIRIASGTGHKVYHNSVNLYGAMPGVTSTNLTTAFLMTATTQTGVDVRNNIFANQVTGGNPAGTRNVAVALPTGGTAAMNLTINNNAYYGSSDALSRLAQVGTTFGTGEYTVGNFDPTQTTPAANFRAYTSTLSAAGTNDNASFATTSAPPFTSNSDLHIPTGTATRLESGGAAVGVTNDIDLDTRNATTPDIGADEFTGNPPPANDIAAAAFISPTSGSTLPVGQTFAPQASFTNNGTATQTNVTVRYRIVNSSSVEIYNQTATITTIAPLQVAIVSFPTTSLPAAGTYTIEARAELAGDSNTANDSISGTLNAVAPVTGTINVGTGETYTSLTNPGGVFQALNTAGISGNLVVNITTDLTAETGAVVLNQLAEVGAGGYTVTFKPSGAARVISGTAPANTGLITLNGADRIIFDGSLSGGTDRSLTITNNQTGTSTVIWMRTPNSSNGANNNTFKNLIINGATGATATTTAGILTGSSVTIGGDAEAASNNNTIQNNFIYRVQNSLYLRGGATAPVFDQNWTVVDNEMGSVASTADKNLFRGMLIGNAANFTISRNLIRGVQSSATTTAAMSGIQLGLLLSNGTVTRNNITDIKNISTTGTGAYGISVIATSTASNVTIANNFVSDVATTGLATIASNGFGMSFNSTTGGSGYNVYYNSVNMNTNQTSAQTSAAVFVNSTFATAGAIDLRNNILANTQTTGTRYAVYSSAPATVFSTINYNDYFAQNVGFIGGSARATLADWQTATGQDANSVAVDPLFVSPTNLHLQATSPVLNLGTPIATVTDDIDGDTRSATTPEIGADEVASVATPGSLQFSSATYSINENGGTQTVTVTRTGGSDGSVSVNYATGGGTATGGASCGGSVDYVSASGTLTFAAGVTSQTFNVTICNDATDEPNETFNYTLSGATGGATIGTPSTAVQTIVDDDVPSSAYTVSIGDVRVIEADAGTTSAVFTVTLTAVAPVSNVGGTIASVQYATANGTAVAGSDYSATSGTLNFTSTGTQTITVPVTGDTVKEANETFFVNLSNPSANVSILDNQGVGIIIDRDRTYVADYDRDYIADYSVYRPSNSTFYMSKSTKGFPIYQTFGTTGDVSVPGDYDNDGKIDFALFTPSTGNWAVLRSSDNTVSVINWGVSTDKPVQGDYTGDGKTDYAVYRPSTGVWYVLPNSNETPYSLQFGISTDRPVQADYDGDFKTDLAVYRDGDWYILNSSNGSVTIRNWGLAADKPVVGDFDGDGRNDLTVYRDGIWYISRSLTNDFIALSWGVAGDIPVAADYNADGTTDVAVWKPSTGDWFVLKSAGGVAGGGGTAGFNWGSNGDKPTPASYLPQ